MTGGVRPNSIRVLLVEDNEFDRVAFRRALRKGQVGYEIHEFVRAEEALEELTANPHGYDLLVVDQGLPGMSGLDLCKMLIAKKVPIPKVILTGGGSEQLAVVALKAGVEDYMVKDMSRGYLELLPVVLPDVIKRHDDHMARLKAEAELRSLVEELTLALAQVKTLSGLVPICSHCKKIRDDKGYWQAVEEYISKHSQAEFSHGICPDCIKELYPDLDGEEEEQ